MTSERKTQSNCCDAELIITPAFPIKERRIVCGNCGLDDKYGGK